MFDEISDVGEFWRISKYLEVTSTNDIAKKIASEGAREGAVIVAQRQTGGRGRSGKEWLSPVGGLWFSIILRPAISPQEINLLTFLASVSVCNIINERVRTRSLIKWPNDILIDEKKVCGILTETAICSGSLEYVVIGIGINTNNRISRFPMDFRKNSISLIEITGEAIENEALLRRLLGEIEEYYRILKLGDYDRILRDWKELCCILGKEITLHENSETFTGVAIDVDLQGALLIMLEDGNIRNILSANIEL
jgi:BirA family biotin operon repressor/biotin-[acetyl-CoA-carboxylase] ligase